jgi:S-DNA-T family DNA segregation ATPase FtsK/SpoIIIE
VLIAKLATLGVPCELEKVIEGPAYTRYELRPSAGILMREILRTADDLAFELGAYPARILAPLPDRAGLIAVELPCAERRIVRLDDLPPALAPLSFPLGLDTNAEPIYCDLAHSPHLLVAGETGSGKSSLINAMLCSLLSSFDLDALGLVLIDPKQVELTPYQGLPQLLTPVAGDVKTAIASLRGLVRLMDVRYEAAAALSARSLPEVNTKLEAGGRNRWPYIVCVVDELADLMLASRKQCEPLIVRLAQKARAVGIHLVLATQSPRVKVLTGLISANISTRIAFKVAKQADSRVILDRNAAESLLGRGDALLSMAGAHPVRFQGALVEADEIHATCDGWRRHV